MQLHLIRRLLPALALVVAGQPDAAAAAPSGRCRAVPAWARRRSPAAAAAPALRLACDPPPYRRGAVQQYPPWAYGYGAAPLYDYGNAGDPGASFHLHQHGGLLGQRRLDLDFRSGGYGAPYGGTPAYQYGYGYGQPAQPYGYGPGGPAGPYGYGPARTWPGS